jgi:hypothetical protein
MGVKSDPSLLAVSGRAAANLAYTDGLLKLEDVLGEPGRRDHDVMPSPPNVETRNVALGTPIMYDAKKAKGMDWMDPEMELDGLGDVEASQSLGPRRLGC